MNRMPFPLKRGLEGIKEMSMKSSSAEGPNKHDEPFVDPCTGQTEKSIGAYLRTLQIEDEVWMRTTYAGFLSFEVGRVESFCGRGDSMMRANLIAWHGNGIWYKKSGRNNKAPHGKAQLVEPTPAVRAYHEKYPLMPPPNSIYRYIHIPRE